MTFLNAAFLFAALAALLPLVIHLISRRRVETVDWSSLRFLKELERRRIRRVRIRQILLLVIRSLIILLVALALARPTLRGPFAGAGARARTSVAILLDDSASMTRESGGTRLEDAAVQRSTEVIDLLDDGDEAFLITASEPAKSLLPDGTASPDLLARASDDVSVASASTDYDRAVELALGALATARNLNREIYIVGDLQASGWKGPVTLPSASASEGWPPRAYVLPTEGPESNAGVSSVSVERIYGGTAGRFSVDAEIMNAGRRAIDVPVRLFVDGVQVGQTGAAVEPGGTAPARFAVTLDESDWHGGRVEIARDGFASDDARFFVVPPARPVEVLIASAPGATEDADYLRRALDPTGRGERFRPVVIGLEDLARQEEGRFPVVALANAGRLPSDAEQWVRRHVEEGGGLLVILGSRTDIRAWGGALERLTHATLREPVERRSGVRLAPAGQGHPLLEGLVTGDRMIEDVMVRRAVEAETDAETVLELPGIGPALTFAKTGEGRVATLFFGLDVGAADLARSGLVVPLVHRVAARLAGPAPGAGEGTAGPPLAVTLGRSPSARVDVRDPGGATVAVPVSGDRAPSVVIEDTREAGLYRIESDGATIAMAAVNVDPRESLLSPATNAGIEESLRGVPTVFVGSDETLADAVLTARLGRELWRVFLYAALALIAVEMLVARSRAA